MQQQSKVQNVQNIIFTYDQTCMNCLVVHAGVDKLNSNFVKGSVIGHQSTGNTNHKTTYKCLSNKGKKKQYKHLFNSTKYPKTNHSLYVKHFFRSTIHT